jgi:hypothetical protein
LLVGEPRNYQAASYLELCLATHSIQLVLVSQLLGEMRIQSAPLKKGIFQKMDSFSSRVADTVLEFENLECPASPN